MSVTVVQIVQMSFVCHCLHPKMDAQALEAAKEACRFVLESVLPTCMFQSSWEDVCLSIARASLISQFGGGEDGDESRFADVSVRSIAPLMGFGVFSFEQLARHPRKVTIQVEMKLLKKVLLALPQTIPGIGALPQSVNLVLHDIDEMLHLCARECVPKPSGSSSISDHEILFSPAAATGNLNSDAV